MIKLLMTFILLSGCAYADDKPASGADKSAAKPAQSEEARSEYYDTERFSCQPPAGWDINRNKAGEDKIKVIEVEMLGPRSESAPVMIYATYYAKGNRDFKTYSDFVAQNSKDAIGRTQTPTRKYSPVKESAVKGKKTLSFDREVKEFLSPEGSSEESVLVKESFHVMPAKEGFFVLHYYAPVSVYDKHLPAFRKLISTFKTR